MSVEINARISRSLITKRKELKLTQQQLSDKAKVSLRTIKDIENGRRKSSNESTIITHLP